MNDFCIFTIYMTDAILIKFLSDGYSIREISKECNIEKRVLEYRIVVLRDRQLCKTVTQLVANYLRKRLIE